MRWLVRRDTRHAWTHSVDMTARARAYLLAAAARHIAIGVCAVVAPGAFTSTSLTQIRSVMPLYAWGVIFAVVGVGCAFAAVRESEALARTGLVTSAAASATWTAGFLAAWVAHQLSNPALPIAFAALAVKDLVVCAQPMRSPFERLSRDLSA